MSFVFSAKEKLQNVPWFEMDFVLNFAMCLANFTCEWIHDPDIVFRLALKD